MVSRLLETLAITSLRRATRLVRSLLVPFLVAQIGAATPSADTTRAIRFEHLSTEHGLPHDSIHAICQDRGGFMWFGTQEGLVRYDGYDLTLYDHDPSDPSTLASDWVWSVIEDRDGFLWVGTDGGGLHRFDRATATFGHFRFDEQDPSSLSSDRVRVIFEDREGNLWIGTDAGLDRLEDDGKRFQHFEPDGSDPDSMSSNRVQSIIQDGMGAIWVGTDGGGISRLDPVTGLFVHYRHDPADPFSLGDDRVTEIYQSLDGILWVGTHEAGLDRFNPHEQKFVHYRHDDSESTSLGGDRVRDVFEDSEGTLWVATDGGLSEWQPQDQTFSHHRHAPAEPTGLSDDRVNVVYEDSGGVLWVGTDIGLNRSSLSAASFVHYKHSPGDQSGLSHDVVTAFDEDSTGRVWIGTYGGGLNRLDPATGHFTHYRHEQGRQASLVDDRVRALHIDRTGAVWVGTSADGLDRFDPATGGFTHFRQDPDHPHSLSANAVTSILEDRSGMLWVGTYGGGLNRLDRGSGTFAHYRYDAQNPDSLGSDLVLALHEDRSGILWIGTDGGGLNRFDHGSGTFTRFRHDPQDSSSLSSDSAWSIHEDRSGGFWIGTDGGGLNYWPDHVRRAGLNQFVRYLRSDGLPSAVVYGVRDDWRGRLWLSTNHGLSRLAPETGAVKTYTPQHGVQDLDFNLGALLRARDSRMYFGGSNGFNAFYPEAIVDNQHKPAVVLTGVYKFNTRIPLDVPVEDLTVLELRYDDSVVAFDFAVLDYTEPSRNRYQYKLDGFDQQWNDAGGVRRATYTNLDAGEYTFRVRGANSDGVWSDAGVALQLMVMPPWWLSVWAYVIYGLLAIGAAVRVQWRHRKHLEAEGRHGRRLERDVEARTRELAERNTELAELNRQLKAASYTDALTGLFNRRFLSEQIEKDVALVRRAYMRSDDPEPGDPSRDLLLLMLDVDGLKGVNDRYGHVAGDRALLQVREILMRVCRKSDMLVRWGGDEFLLVGRQSDRVMGEHLAERLRHAIVEHEFDLGAGNTTRMSCSIGFAMYPFVPSAPNLLNWEQVVHMADRGLYEAKGSGRNRYVGIFAARNADPRAVLKRMDDDLEQLADEGILTLRTGPTAATEAAEAQSDQRVPA